MSRHKLVEHKDMYICDPEKKVGICKSANDGEWCGIHCFCTTEQQYAKEPLTKLTSKQWEKEHERRSKAISTPGSSDS